MNETIEAAASAVITAGGGRGFIVRGQFDRYIITAAHCLPHLPPSMSFSDLMERTYRDLLAPLGGEPKVWAECLFVDPIADIALLGPPNDQELNNHYEAIIAWSIRQSCSKFPSQSKSAARCSCRWTAHGSNASFSIIAAARCGFSMQRAASSGECPDLRSW